MAITPQEAQLIETLAPIVAQALPEIVSAIKGIVTSKQPDASSASDAAILAAFHKAVADDIAKDSAWLAAHPVTDVTGQTFPATD